MVLNSFMLIPPYTHTHIKYTKVPRCGLILLRCGEVFFLDVDLNTLLGLFVCFLGRYLVGVTFGKLSGYFNGWSVCVIISARHTDICISLFLIISGLD